MLKRTLFFSHPVYLSLKDNQLVCEYKDESELKKVVPIEDIGFVVIENQQVKISIPLINSLADNNVALVFCDKAAFPNVMIQPLNGNTTQGESYRHQLNATEPLKKSLWKQCIEAKIKNQAQLLSKLNLDGKMLLPLYNNVKSGDSDNREGIAAKLYWKELFGRRFVREREGEPPNNLLNYGYTILRAAVARSLIGSGLFPGFGIFHKSKYNAFPLADDIMEAYRPFIDEIVYAMFHEGLVELNKEAKSRLVRILYVDCDFKTMKRPLDISLTMTTASLSKCYSGKEKKIQFPLLK